MTNRPADWPTAVIEVMRIDEDVFCLEDVVKPLLDRLMPEAERLRLIADRYGPSANMFFAVSLHRERVAYFLSPETVRRLSDLRANFEIDPFDYRDPTVKTLPLARR